MAYKRINAAIRNFAHSFVSVMNYVDDTYIIDLLPKLLRETPGHEIRISLLDDEIFPHREYNRTFLKSIGYYRQCVGDHLRSENVDPNILNRFHFIIFADHNGPICRADAEDDRGKLHQIDVRSGVF
ncbi:MAG: hypothetical protein U9N87_06780 [Planctomycetota bacterium]|nr:hypothetical protein [Planctomycetota bacterium]